MFEPEVPYEKNPVAGGPEQAHVDPPVAGWPGHVKHKDNKKF